MKKLIICLLFMIPFYLIGSAQCCKQAQPLNRISNSLIIKLIEEFIIKENNDEDCRDSKFIYIKMYNVNDSTKIKLRLVISSYPNLLNAYAHEHNNGIIICAPIAGKKVLIHLPNNNFITANHPFTGAYFEKDLPEEYRQYMEYINQMKADSTYCTETVLYDPKRELIIELNEKSEVVKSEYRYFKQCKDKSFNNNSLCPIVHNF